MRGEDGKPAFVLDGLSVFALGGLRRGERRGERPAFRLENW